MGLSLDQDVHSSAITTTRSVVPPELPRHAKVDHDHRIHTFDEFYDRTNRVTDSNEETFLTEIAEAESDYSRGASDKKPLLQEMKITRTSSKKKIKNAQVMKSKVVNTATAGARVVPIVSRTSFNARVKRLRGLVYIVFAALNISLMSACIKYATHYVSSHEAVFWRTVITWALNYVLVRMKKVNLYVEPKHRMMLLFRSFIGMICVSLSYYAVSKMVLTDAIVIIFTSPVLTFLLGAVLLGEAIDRVDFICSLISYVGVVFVTRPAMLFPQTSETKETDSLAVVCALGAAATQACAYIAVRKLHEVHYITISHYFALFGIGFSLLSLWIFNAPLRVPELFTVQLALIASALFSCIGMLFLTLGFQMEKAGIASVMRYFDVVFVFILDTTFLGEDVDGYSVLGGAIIIAGAIVIAIRRMRAKK